MAGTHGSGAGAVARYVHGPTKPSAQTELPIDYVIIEPIVRKRDKIIVKMEDAVLEERLWAKIINPTTGEEAEFGYSYQWGIDVVPYVATIYDKDGTVRGERIWIRKRELQKLEGYVIRFFLEGESFGEYYLDEAAYVVSGGKLVPAPEFLSTRYGR
jgi:hypothetical protein